MSNDDDDYEEIDPQRIMASIFGEPMTEEEIAKDEMQAQSDYNEMEEFLVGLKPREKLLVAGLLSFSAESQMFYRGKLSALMQYIDNVDPSTGNPYTLEGLE